MPSRTTSEYERPSRATARRRARSPCIFSATFSQPRRSTISWPVAESGFQSVASLAHSRRGASSFWSLATVASTLGWRVPRLYHCRGPCPALIAFDCSLSALTRDSNDFPKRSTPSTSSSSVTFSSEIPSSSSCLRRRREASTCSSSERRTSPCSRKAARVAGGTVSTVSGPISSST